MNNNADKPRQYSESYSLFTDFDISLFKSGKHFRLYEKLGSHTTEHNGTPGTYFAIWAPSASAVSVIGNFNYWNGDGYELYPRWDSSGIWEAFIPRVGKGETYKYKIVNNDTGEVLEKGDPFARMWEIPPNTASIVWDTEYHWNDAEWMSGRHKNNALDSPISAYEVHLGSWKRDYRHLSLSYTQLADELVAYVKELGYTHVELMPVMEHPFFGSWGYQITGYFAPTSRYGNPQEFMHLVEAFHRAGIGVFLDWVPSHYPGDMHGLYRFDGSNLYEHADPRQGYHPDWSSYIFNYGRNEVRSFLISNALFWLDKYHVDGLRVDAVASMLYLDYSREGGEWVPNIHGGRENLEAISFMKELNEHVYKEYPDVQTIAEESTSFPMITKPTFLGGLGFGMKWMMGWMNDVLEYFSKEPIHRQYHHNEITFSLAYAFSENFMLPLSHDEVVHGKGPLISRMHGDEWQRFANLRLLYGWMYTHPGTKLLFMGGEIGQTSEWRHDHTVEWYLLDHAPHRGVKAMIADMNRLYKNEPALYERAFSHDGFEWIELNDAQNSVLSYVRKGHDAADTLVMVANFTPVFREKYRIGLPGEGSWKEIFNTDKEEYWGSGQLNAKSIMSENIPYHGRQHSLELSVPPLGISVLKRDA